jgi:phosphonopyruvate decarboxylase
MNRIIKAIKDLDFSSILGVPDSLLANFINALEQSELNNKIHVMPNEGSAIALSAGYYLGTGKPSIVYLQNSGIGNAINPLASLAHRELFGIPMVLIIGWRGSIDTDGSQAFDEPQHLIQGRITINQLGDLKIPYSVAPKDFGQIADLIASKYAEAMEIKGPVAILVKPGIFDHKEIKETVSDDAIESIDAIKSVLELCDSQTLIVSTTGMIGREILQIQNDSLENNRFIFMNIGAMGHASMIAKGLAASNPDHRVVCFDGDGSLAMHLGSLFLFNNLPNFKHIILNNYSHDSVGGQRTSIGSSNLAPLLTYFSNDKFLKIKILGTLEKIELTKNIESESFAIIEFICKPRGSHDLPRPNQRPSFITDKFLNRVMPLKNFK